MKYSNRNQVYAQSAEAGDRITRVIAQAHKDLKAINKLIAHLKSLPDLDKETFDNVVQPKVYYALYELKNIEWLMPDRDRSLQEEFYKLKTILEKLYD